MGRGWSRLTTWAAGVLLAASTFFFSAALSQTISGAATPGFLVHLVVDTARQISQWSPEDPLSQLKIIPLLYGATAGVAALLGWALLLAGRANPPRTALLSQLERQIDKFTQVFDRNFALMDRLRSMAVNFSEAKFQAFTDQIMRLLITYTSGTPAAKVAFIIVPSAQDNGNEAGVVLVSVEIEEIANQVASSILDLPLTKAALSSGQTQLVRDTTRSGEGRGMVTTDGWAPPGCRAAILTPVRVTGAMRGIIGVYGPEANLFSHDSDAPFLEMLAILLATASAIRLGRCNECGTATNP